LEEAVAMTGLSPEQAWFCKQRHWSIPVYIKNEDALGEIKAKVEALGYACISGGRFVHIQGVCDKGLASNVILDAYERRDGVAYRVIALGDSENDRMMLEQASIAVVVRSKGRAMTLTRADAITTELEAPQGWVDGLYRAIGEETFE
jgi:mannosyl-3-phosphoglycerate phosphatase